MDRDIGDDLAQEALHATAEMQVYLAEINRALDDAVDHGSGLEYAADGLEQAHDVYGQLGAVVERAISYGDAAGESRPVDDPAAAPDADGWGYARAALAARVEDRSADAADIDGRQVMEFVPVHEAMRGFEDTVLRFVGIRDRVETLEYGSLQGFLDDHGPVELPGEMSADEFTDAEYVA